MEPVLSHQPDLQGEHRGQNGGHRLGGRLPGSSGSACWWVGLKYILLKRLVNKPVALWEQYIFAENTGEM